MPAVSVVTPEDFLTQQQIPWFGSGYDTTYCTDGRSRFRPQHLRLPDPDRPEAHTGIHWELLKKELASKGIDNPTAALLGTDTTSGKAACRTRRPAATGVGFKVVYAKGAFPGPPAVVGDYTPYAAGPAHVERRQGTRRDLHVDRARRARSRSTSLLNANGYTGTYLSPFYSPLLVGALKGAYVFLQFAGIRGGLCGHQDDERATIEAFKPGHEAVARPSRPGTSPPTCSSSR